MIFIITQHDTTFLTKRLNELKIKKYDMVVLSWTFNRFFLFGILFRMCSVPLIKISPLSALKWWCLGSCWTRLCNSCRDIGKSHIFTLANYSIWPKFFVKRHTALECWASALFMQRWPVFFQANTAWRNMKSKIFQIFRYIKNFMDFQTVWAS